MTMTGFHRKVLTGVLIFLLPVFLIGCTSPPAWHQPVTLERSAGKDLQSEEAGGIGPSEEAKQPVVEEIRIPAFERKAPEKMLPPSQPIDPRRLTMANQPVTLNAERMPLSDFVIYALGETLKVAFVMDEKMMNCPVCGALLDPRTLCQLLQTRPGQPFIAGIVGNRQQQ